ncbi:methionine adenosyltransferase, partial [Candidatus Liberibacter asiaticus]
MSADFLFTSESVSEGHPDKICDRISDEIVDLVYREAIESKMDVNSVRVACEVLVTKNKVIVAGEVRLPHGLSKKDSITGQYVVDKEKFEKVVRSVIRSIGYEQEGFHWETVDVEVLLHSQSSDI